MVLIARVPAPAAGREKDARDAACPSRTAALPRAATAARARRTRGVTAHHRMRARGLYVSEGRCPSIYGSSHFPARMHGGDAARKIAMLHLGEAGLLYSLRERSLRRKAADALREVAIGGAIAGDQLAQTRQH